MFTKERIESELENWDSARLMRLKRYYAGEHDILQRETEGSKPNNKLVHNYASYIVDMFQGYFIGNPVVYSSQDNKLMDLLQDIFDFNDEQDENSELARHMGIYGRGIEIVYVDEEANICFNEINPESIKVIYDDSIRPKIIGAIRQYEVVSDDGEEVADYLEVYDELEIMTLKMPEMSEVERRPHYFKGVPVVDFKNNSDTKGDFEGVISLIDAYNLSRSSKTNDLEYFTDAFMYLVGMAGTTAEDVDDMRERRVLLLEEAGEAGFLIKPSNVEDAREQIERLNNDIHKFSKALDMSDENFANSPSGVAYGYKLLAMEQIAANKERKFKRGLQRRIELICDHLNMKTSASYNYLDISTKFERNEPVDEATKIAGAMQLNQFTSKETALSFLPSSIVPDIQEEMERLDVEREVYGTDVFNNAGENIIEGDQAAIDEPEE